MRTTGPTAEKHPWTRGNCSAGPATSKNTPKTNDNDADDEPRGGPFPTTPEIHGPKTSKKGVV
jgi:hypothetical protein